MPRAALGGIAFEPSTHPGLWLDKMFDPAADAEGARAKADHIAHLKRAEAPFGYREAYAARARDLMNSRATVLHARALSRVVVGLGARGVLEAGLRLEPSWGVPILPGPALKGVAAAAAHQLCEGEAWRKPDDWPRAKASEPPTSFELLFGTQSGAGLVTFHDAWWLPSGGAPFAPDIMTVHHPDYYQKPEANAPAPTDFDSPTPIPFVTSAKGSFLVALEGPGEWCDAARTLLDRGLRELGIGAKTSSGYGRLALEMPFQHTLGTLANTKQHQGRELPERIRAFGIDTFPEAAPAIRDFVTTWAADAGFGPAQLKNLSEDHQRWFRGFLQVSSAPPPNAAAAPAEKRPAWLSGKAWIAKDKKNRETLYVIASDEKRYDRETRLVGIGGERLDKRCPERLREATEQTPVTVRFLLKGRGKIAEVNLEQE